MIQIRKSGERGHAMHGWLDSYHTFSFANYYDPKFTGFRSLLVINEDRVKPGQGFGKHGHQDMEIISYVLEGELAHKDSLGSGSVLHPGDFQRMSAGTGVKHSEFNHSNENEVHFLQIWIEPKESGIQPSYEEKTFSSEAKKNQFRLIASPTGEGNSLTLHQDAKVFATVLETGKEVSHSLGQSRYGWIQIARGSIVLNGIELQKGDGAAIYDEPSLRVIASQPSEFLFFDLP
jgi:redox-sensitive bicupin YhaK (pirin superfamily)